MRAGAAIAGPLLTLACDQRADSRAVEAPLLPQPRRRAPSASAAPTPRPLTWSERTWSYAETSLGPVDVVALVPSSVAADTPLLVAFHGLGESRKGPRRGARGWVDDYRLLRAARALSEPPLDREDFRDMVRAARINRLSDSLAERPFRGLVVLCPYLPAVLRGEQAFERGPDIARLVVETLLPRARKELGVRGEPQAVGVDGVSLGGRAALMVGLARPEAFGAVGVLQPAIDAEEVERLGAMARAATERHSALRLRLLSSDEDYFLEPTRELSRALKRLGVRHQLDIVAGDHGYEFNRGPGSLEMLIYHDRALRGEPPL